MTALVTLLSTGLLVPLGGAHAATTVPLGTADSFAILAYSTITNTGPSVVSGDAGLHPGSSVTGFGDVTHVGTLYVADGVALQAKSDLDTAYTNAAGQLPEIPVAVELGGKTLTPGIYTSGEFGVTGNLTLDGEGDPDAVFIFKAASTLTTASASSVNVINGANLCNVFWQVGSSATLGSNSTFRGTIMANDSITLTTAATLEGRALARTGAVTLDTNVITSAGCAPPTTTDDTDDTDDTTGDADTTGDGDTSGGADTTGDGDTTGDADTTGDGDTSGGADTGGGADTTNGDSSDGGGDTTGQIHEIPSGGVATGGGPAQGSGGSLLLAAGVLALVGLASRLRITAHRRAQV